MTFIQKRIKIKVVNYHILYKYDKKLGDVIMNSSNEKCEELKINVDKLKVALTEAEKLINENNAKVSQLAKDFDQLIKLSDTAKQQLENTSETVKVIQNIALNTRILGFNASIEASRAKESGKGFGVIAQEVRSLADVSKTSAEKIEEIIESISEIANEIHTTVISTNDTVKTAFGNMNNMNTLLGQMKEISKDI